MAPRAFRLALVLIEPVEFLRRCWQGGSKSRINVAQGRSRRCDVGLFYRHFMTFYGLSSFFYVLEVSFDALYVILLQWCRLLALQLAFSHTIRYARLWCAQRLCVQCQLVLTTFSPRPGFVCVCLNLCLSVPFACVCLNLCLSVPGTSSKWLIINFHPRKLSCAEEV